jgi:hypothetical protein
MNNLTAITGGLLIGAGVLTGGAVVDHVLKEKIETAKQQCYEGPKRTVHECLETVSDDYSPEAALIGIAEAVGVISLARFEYVVARGVYESYNT